MISKMRYSKHWIEKSETFRFSNKQTYCTTSFDVWKSSFWNPIQLSDSLFGYLKGFSDTLWRLTESILRQVSISNTSKTLYRPKNPDPSINTSINVIIDHTNRYFNKSDDDIYISRPSNFLSAMGKIWAWLSFDTKLHIIKGFRKKNQTGLNNEVCDFHVRLNGKR